MGVIRLCKEISQLLTDSEKSRWKRCMAAVATSTLLDFFGLASLLPLLYYLMADGDNRNAAVLFGGVAVVFILAKSIAGIWLRRYQSAYLQGLFNRLSLSLYRYSFARGLLHVKSHGVSRIGHEITWVCHVFCQNLLGTMMRLTGDLILVLLVSAAVVVMAPISALILGVPLVTVIVVCRKVIGKKAQREGDAELIARRKLTSTINDTFGGFPDIMVANSFPSFERDFTTSLDRITQSRLKMELYNGFLMPLCELAVTVSLSLMAFIGPGDGAKMALGLFAVAAFRVVPAIRGIIYGSLQIKNASASIETIKRLNNTNEPALPYPSNNENQINVAAKPTAIDNTGNLSIKNISFSFSGGKNVIDNFSCTVRQGEYVGIKGESGVGKSTLFNIILGLIQPDSGSVSIGDYTSQKSGLENWIGRFGYVPQEVFVFNASVATNIALGVDTPNKELIAEILREVSLDKWIASLPDGMDTILGERGMTLSGGERQRLGLARALYGNCSILLLDEATSALDANTEADILHAVDEARARHALTVISIAHRDSSLANCSRIITL